MALLEFFYPSLCEATVVTNCWYFYLFMPREIKNSQVANIENALRQF